VMRGQGLLTETFADQFRGPAPDFGPANAELALLALDVLTAHQLAPSGMPGERHARAYLESLQRRTSDRKLLMRHLQDQGWRTVPVPAISEERRGISSINAIQSRDVCWAPEYGGLMASVDRAALHTIRSHIAPSARLAPVRSGETQRRAGGVRCAINWG
jgi:hypothetical protein